MISPLIIMIVLWLSLITYAVLGGADFGGGVWALLARGPDAQRQQRLVEHAIGPVWEANNVWLIYLVVGLYIAFPPAAYTIAVALFIPFTLILLGIVLRGAAFAFATHIARAVQVRAAWTMAFSAASIVTPFLLGCVAAAIASGKIRYINGEVQADRWGPWLTPFALSVGAVALAMCATLAAVFLTVEAQYDHDLPMMRAFRRRALIAGAVTAALGLLSIILAQSGAPKIAGGLFHQALPVVILTMLAGAGCAWALYTRRFTLARALVVGMTAGLLGAWGLAQAPDVVPPDLTLTNAASPPLTLTEFFWSAVVGMSLLIPSLWFLFRVFKGRNPLFEERGRELEEG